jgi:hypothetical protein
VTDPDNAIESLRRNPLPESALHVLIDCLKKAARPPQIHYQFSVMNRQMSNETAVALRNELKRVNDINKSVWLQVVMLLLAVKKIDRLEGPWYLRRTPSELIRRLAEVCPQDVQDD